MFKIKGKNLSIGIMICLFINNNVVYVILRKYVFCLLIIYFYLILKVYGDVLFFL